MMNTGWSVGLAETGDRRGQPRRRRIVVGRCSLRTRRDIRLGDRGPVSTLEPHRAWGAVAVFGYGVATVIAATQLWGHWCGRGARVALTASVWATTTLLPLLIQAVQRANGRTDRAQEEVLVIEDAGRRLLETGTPYLDRAAIAGLPVDDRLLAYMPYQPGMAVFGVPRALDPSAAWWSDARVFFALVTGLCVAVAMVALRRAGAPAPALVRALQAATVLPVCASPWPPAATTCRSLDSACWRWR